MCVIWRPTERSTLLAQHQQIPTGDMEDDADGDDVPDDDLEKFGQGGDDELDDLDLGDDDLGGPPPKGGGCVRRAPDPTTPSLTRACVQLRPNRYGR